MRGVFHVARFSFYDKYIFSPLLLVVGLVMINFRLLLCSSYWTGVEAEASTMFEVLVLVLVCVSFSSACSACLVNSTGEAGEC